LNLAKWTITAAAATTLGSLTLRLSLPYSTGGALICWSLISQSLQETDMTAKKKEAIQAAREEHKQASAALLATDPQSHPALYRDYLYRYVEATDALIGHILGEDGDSE
jgi:hypothetical protein